MLQKRATKITQKKRAAIQAILKSGSLTEASKIAGCTRNTIHGYLNQPEFNAALQHAEWLAISQSARLIATGATISIRRLIEIVQGADDKNAIHAARVLIQNMPSIRMIGSLEHRIYDLETLKDRRDELE